jgi:hypothetical protein
LFAISVTNELVCFFIVFGVKCSWPSKIEMRFRFYTAYRACWVRWMTSEDDWTRPYTLFRPTTTTRCRSCSMDTMLFLLVSFISKFGYFLKI